MATITFNLRNTGPNNEWDFLTDTGGTWGELIPFWMEHYPDLANYFTYAECTESSGSSDISEIYKTYPALIINDTLDKETVIGFVMHNADTTSTTRGVTFLNARYLCPVSDTRPNSPPYIHTGMGGINEFDSSGKYWCRLGNGLDISIGDFGNGKIYSFLGNGAESVGSYPQFGLFPGIDKITNEEILVCLSTLNSEVNNINLNKPFYNTKGNPYRIDVTYPTTSSIDEVVIDEADFGYFKVPDLYLAYPKFNTAIAHDLSEQTINGMTVMPNYGCNRTFLIPEGG